MPGKRALVCSAVRPQQRAQETRPCAQTDEGLALEIRPLRESSRCTPKLALQTKPEQERQLFKIRSYDEHCGKGPEFNTRRRVRGFIYVHTNDVQKQSRGHPELRCGTVTAVLLDTEKRPDLQQKSAGPTSDAKDEHGNR